MENNENNEVKVETPVQGQTTPVTPTTPVEPVAPVQEPTPTPAPTEPAKEESTPDIAPINTEAITNEVTPAPTAPVEPTTPIDPTQPTPAPMPVDPTPAPTSTEGVPKSKPNLLLIIAFVVVVLGGGFYLFKSFYLDKRPIQTDQPVDNNQQQDMGLNFDGNVNITNQEVNTLYNYVKASLNSNNVCLGFYYQNPFSKHTQENKVAIILANYVKKETATQDEVIKGMKEVFNIDVTTFDENANYGYYKYNSANKTFTQASGGGSYNANIIQQIISYKENTDTIEIIEIKAEQSFENNKLYRYVNKTVTETTDAPEGFKFTKDNYTKYEQINYIFAKNGDHYYVKDIVNLNYPEDLESCN